MLFLSLMAVVPQPTFFPSRSTVKESVSAMTSSRSCETNMTLIPSCATECTSRNRMSTSVFGKKTVGSSKTKSPRPFVAPSCRLTTARKIASMAFCTGPRLEINSFGFTSSPYCANVCSISDAIMFQLIFALFVVAISDKIQFSATVRESTRPRS